MLSTHIKQLTLHVPKISNLFDTRDNVTNVIPNTVHKLNNTGIATDIRYIFTNSIE